MVLIEDVDEEQENEAQAAQWRRIQVVEEDSDDADGAAQPSLRVWSDPCPDLEISCSVAGAEDAKSRGNRLFGDGKLAECERWFTKALWLYESGKVQDFPGDLRCALQTNRALCRLKLQRFQDAEQDCSAALEEKPTNGKARYRRALARFEQGKLIPGLQDAARAVQDLPADSRDEAQQLKTRIEEHLKAGTGGGGQLGGNESNTSKENSYRKIPIREVDKAAVPASAKSPAPAPQPAASAPAPGFKRMEIVEASDSEEEQADSAKAPTPTPAKPASAKSPAPAPKPAASAPAPGFKRMEIVEASDSEDEEPRKPSEPKPAMAEVNGLNEYGSQEELHPDIQVEPTMAGAEKAKQRANELFQKGQLDESVRWFSKAIWLLESGKIAGANGTFRSVLYSNRAFARSKMQQWALVEEDANQALSSNEKNAKALYRRAHARLELKKLDGALQDVDLLIPMLASPSDKEALELKQRILEQKAQSELFTREEVEAAKDAGSKLFSQQDLHGAVEQFTKALRMLDSFQVLEAESDPSWASSTRGALFSNRALVNLRLEQWQASEEDCTESLKFNPQGVKAFYRRAMAREKLNRVDDALKDTEEALRLQPNAEELLALQRRLQVLKPKVETPRGFKRMEIVEASEEEEEEEEEVVAEAKPNEAAIEAPAEPFADIELEHTVAGAEKAKDMGNKLFQEGKIQECERWFSKAIWLVEESGKVSAPDTLRGILHSNRAFARLRMQRWSSAELDCDEALQLNGKNPKALYRRAMARKELKKLQGALHDINELLPMLEQKKDALKLKEELEAEIASTHPAMNGEVQKASEASEVPPAAEVPPALEVPPEALRPTSAPPCPPAPQTAVPAEKPVEASRPSSAPRASREARTLASAPSLPSNIPKNSMEMLRQFKSLKKHPEVLTKYVTEKVSPALLQSLFCRSPIEADDLALVLQSLRTAANDTDRPLTGERIGEYLQQLLRTHAAETQFSMLSSAEKELLRNLATMAPNGDELKKSFAKVL